MLLTFYMYIIPLNILTYIRAYIFYDSSNIKNITEIATTPIIATIDVIIFFITFSSFPI